MVYICDDVIKHEETERKQYLLHEMLTETSYSIIDH